MDEIAIRRLEMDGIIRKILVDRQKVRDAVRLAERDLALAKRLAEQDCDWAFSIAYNALLQSGRAIMFSEGYRTSSDSHHSGAVKFLSAYLGNPFEREILAFDRMRRKRSVAIYDTAGSVTRSEVEFAIDTATKFLEVAKKRLSAFLGD